MHLDWQTRRRRSAQRGGYPWKLRQAWNFWWMKLCWLILKAQFHVQWRRRWVRWCARCPGCASRETDLQRWWTEPRPRRSLDPSWRTTFYKSSDASVDEPKDGENPLRTQVCVARVVVEKCSPERYIKCSIEKPNGAYTFESCGKCTKSVSWEREDESSDAGDVSPGSRNRIRGLACRVGGINGEWK
jgi:hypothetical protein